MHYDCPERCAHGQQCFALFELLPVTVRPLIRAVVFDMDGLMLNTEDLYDEVLDNLLAEFGCHFTQELKWKIMGLRDPVAIGVLREDCRLPDSVESLQRRIQGEMSVLLKSSLRTLPGLHELLELVEERRLPKAVATSSSAEFADRALRKSGLLERFEFVLTSADVTEGKPHPEIYFTAAARLGVEPCEVLVLEDSRHGSQAAVSAGAFTVAVPGHHSRGLDFSHANLVVDSLLAPQLVELLAP